MNEKSPSNVVTMTAELAAAYLSSNKVSADQLPGIISSLRGALSGLDQPVVAAAPVADLSPAVPIKRSVTPEFIISLESGKKMKMLKRYLATRYGMTPADYRAKWGLPSDYPMVAPNYAAKRSLLAKEIGLGKPNATPAAAAPAPEPEPVVPAKPATKRTRRT